MAKKLSLSDLTNESRRPAWAASLRQEQQEKRDKAANAELATRELVKQIQDQEGIVIPEDQIRDIAREYERTGEFNFTPRTADFSGVTSTVESTANDPKPQATADQGLLSRLGTYGSAAVDALQSGLQQSYSALRFRQGDTPDGSKGDPFAGVRGLLPDAPKGLADALREADPLEAVRIGTPAERAAQAQARRKELMATADEYGQAAAANQEEVKKARALLEQHGGVEKWATQAVLDAAESPTGALSIIGGPTAGIGIEDVFNREYQQARQAGLSQADAETWARSQAAPETIGMIPAGKLFGKTPVGRVAAKGLANRLTSPGLRAAITTAKTMAGEATEEMATGAIADLTAAALAGQSEQEKLKAYAKDQLPKDSGEFFERRAREGAAALVMGGVLGTPHSIREARASFNEDVENRTNETTEQAVKNAQAEGAVTPVPVRQQRNIQPSAEAQQDLFPETVPGPTSEVPEAPARQAPPTDNPMDDVKVAEERRAVIKGRIEDEQARIADLEQREQDAPLLRETGYDNFTNQDAAELERSRQRLEALKREEGRWSGAAVQQDSLPLNTPKQPKPAKPTNTQTRGGDKYITPEGTEGSNVRDAASKEATKALEAQTKADAAKVDKDFANANKKFQGDRRKALTNLTEQSRQLPAEQRAEFITNGIINWDATNKPPVKGETPATQTEAVVPDTATPQAPVSKVAAKPGSTDAQLDDIAKKLSLGMQENEDAKPEGERTQFDAKQFEDSIRAVVHGLAKDNSQASVDAINLINQGKMVLAPSPESIGREATNDVAQYDPSTGKMYMYTDRVNPENAIGAVVRTYHEATHAGQFNDRQGRPDILRQMMGTGKADAAQKAILRAAENGNRLAETAVRKAKAAAQGDGNIENLEVLPYFVGEVANARGTTLGQLRGVGQDMLTSARNFVRKATGKNFDVDWRDLQQAVSQVGGEIVRTDLAPSQEAAGNLGMIYGEGATDFEDALNRGQVYTSTSDRRRKFVLSDAESQMVPGAEAILASTELSSTDTVPLDMIMRHDTLFRNMPEARNIQVRVTDDMARGTMGQYWPGENLIQVSPNVLAGNSNATVREVILHEVQHWAQEQEGGPDVFVDASNRIGYNGRERAAVRAHREAKAANDLAGAEMMQVAGRIVDVMPGKTSKAVARSIINGNRTPTRKALDFGRLVQDTEMKIPDPEARAAYNKFAETLNAYRETIDGYNNALMAKRERYVSDPTEAEAFFTQRNADTPQNELPVNPEMEDFDFGTEQGADTGRMALARQLRESSAVEEAAVAANAPLGMAAEETPEVNQRRIPAWLTGLVRADKGLSRLDNEVIEHAIASPAGARMKAEAEMGKYDVALDRMASEQGKTKTQLNKEIEDAINNLPKDLDGHAANVAAFNAAMQPFGNAGKAMMNLRDQVDDLTLSILQQRADSGVPLTEQEKNLYKTLVANMGRYTHRQYAAHAGKLGNKYSNIIYKDYERVKDGSKKVTPVQQENYQKVADAVQYLVDKNLSIPDDDGISKLGADQTRNLYNTWGKVGNPDGLTLDQMKDELAANRDRINGDKAALDNEAEAITRDLLGLTETNSPISTYYRGGKQDNSILKQRENIPPVLRSLMGEITDPSMRLTMTVAKQAEFVGRNKMMLELSKSAGGDLLPPGSQRPKGWVRLDGEGYGPLRGYLASPNMVSAIGDVQQQLATFEQAVAMASRNPKALAGQGVQAVATTWGKAAAASKMLQVIWSPMNFVYNFVGGPMTMLTNGNINPANFGKGALAAKDLISYAVNPRSATAEATRLVRNDVVDSAFVGEIKNEQYRDLRKVVMDMAGRGQSPTMETIGDLLNKSKAGFKETYAMMDVLYKIANFYDQVDHLTDFYQKNGDVRTPEQIDREAADVVKRTNFTYRRVAPMLKAIEANGFSAFGPYMHEVFRTQIAGVFQGISELQRAKTANTPEARNKMMLQGAKRLTGMATAWGMTGYASALLSGITFGEDDDENEAKRALLPEFNRDQDFVEVGKDAKGNPVMFNMARFDPIGPATDIMRSILQGGMDIDDTSKKMLDLYVTPRIGPQAVTAVKATFDRGTKTSRVPLVQELAPEQYSTLLDAGRAIGIPPRVAKAWTNVAETMYPGIATAWRSTNGRPAETDLMGTTLNTATYLGMQLQAVDPSKSMKFSGMAYSDAVKYGRRDLAEMFQDNPDRTGEEVLSYVLKLRDTEKKAFDEVRKVYEGALATGMTPRQAAAMMKEQKLSGDQIRAVSTNNFATGIISTKSLTEFEKKELSGKSREEQREIKQKWKDVRDLLKSTSRELKEEDAE